jgi:hypothetical protein
MRFESKFSSVGPKLRLDPERKKIDKMITLLPQLKEAVARGHYLRDLLREIAEENGWTLTDSSLASLYRNAKIKAEKMGIKNR